jgi:site-specific recombinase XerD
MQINDAIRLTIDFCERKHLSLSTWKTYTHWINRYALFLKGLSLSTQSTEQKIEAFLTKLANTGITEADRVASPLREFVPAPGTT